MTSASLLVLDQGTTSSRAVLFSERADWIDSEQRELKQSFPQDGWVEHDAEEIWQDCLSCARTLLQRTSTSANQLDAIGLTNQRETIVLWDRATGLALHPALVWQDRRTAQACESLRASGWEERVTQRTGLLLDPYFSASKLQWLLDHLPGARERAARGELAAGTVDSWLIYKLTNGRSHVTDRTNASRTLLYDIHTEQWCDELLTRFGVERSLLPQVLPSVADFGTTASEHFGAAIKITGVAGDQQAAAFGQAVHQAGQMKATYGTGCFTIRPTGKLVVTSTNRLLTTIAASPTAQPSYAIEGSIFHAGTVVQWLRDGLGLIQHAEESEALLQSAREDSVFLVPAFTGLGAPWWDPHARGLLSGLTRDTGRAEIVRAGLESVAWQSLDLLAACDADCGSAVEVLRVDGGMANNDGFLQLLADVLQIPVERPKTTESTALGAAFLAGIGCGSFTSEQDCAQVWQLERQFEPKRELDWRDSRHKNWRAAVQRSLEKPATRDNSAC